MDAPRLTRYPTTDGKEGWAKEIGDMVMPASSDEVALWKEVERLREALAFAASVIKSGEPWTTTCEEVIGGALGHAR
jgi:hypothetical protein